MYGFPSWMGVATIASFAMLAIGNAWAFWKTLQKIKGIEACCSGAATSATQTIAAFAALAKLKQGLEAAKTIDEAKEYVEKHLGLDQPVEGKKEQ
jgi:hypothetical protein